MSAPRRAEALPFDRGKRRGTGLDAMSRIAVEVGATRHQQPEFGCHRVIPLNRSLVVVRMVDLERIESGGGERLDSRVDARPSRMRERSHASRAMDDADDNFRCRSRTSDEGRAAVGQETVEGFFRIGDVTSSYQGTSD